jgi:hypothetical protein
MLRLGIALLVLCACVPANAQSVRATLSGTVFDSSGAAIPAARVTVLNTERNTPETRVANEVGRYLFPDLVPGHYEIESSAPGFKSRRVTGIAIEVGQQLEMNHSLEVGQTGDSVTVSASAVELETTNATVSGVVGTEQVADLPLNARDFYSLLQLVPNVRAGVPGVSSSQVPSINGGRGWGVEAAVDGAPATALGANPAPGAASPAYNTGLDNIAQFRVLTNTLSAEYGNSFGGYISVATKAGANSLHGSLFEYLRNSAMDSNNFFSNRAGFPLGSFRRHQFGGTIGGPVVRNRTFFFFYYDGLRASTAVSTVVSVPTLIQRKGDFSQTYNSLRQLITIYDPQSTVTNAAGTASTRTPFAGNVIPTGRFDSVSTRMLALLPSPNTAGNAVTGANNLLSADSNRSVQNKYDVRIDHRFNDAHSFFARGSYTRINSHIAAPLGPLDNNVGRDQPVWNGAFDYTWVKSSTAVVNVRYSFNRVEAINNPSGVPVEDYTTLGFSSGFARAIGPIYHYMPQMNIASMTTWGPANSSIVTPVNQQIAGSLTKVRGRHSFKFGADWRLLGASIAPAGAPQFSFGTSYTQGPNPSLASAAAGYGFASFLIGAGSGTITANPPVQVTAPMVAAYTQDDWKISRRLTLNLGIRYDLYFPRREAENRLNFFDATMVHPLTKPSGFDVRGGLQFVNQNGNGRTQVGNDFNNFSPRIGLAYSVDDRTVVRTGFAIMYAPPNYSINVSNAGVQGFEALSQWVSDANSLRASSTLATAFQTGLQTPTSGALGAMTNVGAAISTSSPQYSGVSTYSAQWNFSVQRTLVRNTILEVSYLGNRGIHLPIYPGLQINTLGPEQMARGTELTRLVPNPFYGLITSGNLSGATTSVSQLLRPFPQYTGVNILFDPGADSGYHALGVRVQSRLRRDYILSASYTKGKQIDNSSEHWGTTAAIQNFHNLAGERSLSTQDISQTFVTSGIAPLPVGRGRALLSGASGPVQAMLGGWQLNAILTLQTGIPVSITCQNNTTGSQGGGCRPNSTGRPAKLDSRVQDRLDRYFDGSQFTQPPNYTYGNLSRALPDVRAPGLHNLDLSIFKNFRFGERVRLQFRAEAFNLANHPLFGPPGSAFGGPTFAVIATQVNTPRQMQMALRIDF